MKRYKKYLIFNLFFILVFSQLSFATRTVTISYKQNDSNYRKAHIWSENPSGFEKNIEFSSVDSFGYRKLSFKIDDKYTRIGVVFFRC